MSSGRYNISLNVPDNGWGHQIHRMDTVNLTLALTYFLGVESGKRKTHKAVVNASLPV